MRGIGQAAQRCWWADLAHRRPGCRGAGGGWASFAMCRLGLRSAPDHAARQPGQSGSEFIEWALERDSSWVWGSFRPRGSEDKHKQAGGGTEMGNVNDKDKPSVTRANECPRTSHAAAAETLSPWLRHVKGGAVFWPKYGLSVAAKRLCLCQGRWVVGTCYPGRPGSPEKSYGKRGWRRRRINRRAGQSHAGFRVPQQTECTNG